MPDEYYKEVARTIIDQIKQSVLPAHGKDRRARITGFYAMACWGARNFVAMPAVRQAEGNPSLGGLKFKVSGRLHEGHVIVKFAPNDTYTLEFWKFPNTEPTKSVFDIYFDQLAEVLDSYIETGRLSE